jgi:hypothetical protein
MNNKTFLILGAKWFDKVNGNTYCNARVINGSTGETEFYIGYQYGYGSQYAHEARKLIEQRFGADAKSVDLGCFYIKKADLKDNNF